MNKINSMFFITKNNCLSLIISEYIFEVEAVYIP